MKHRTFTRILSLFLLAALLCTELAPGLAYAAELPEDEPAAAAEEPAQDEPAAEEPAAEEPAQDEPAAEEPAQDEPAAEEPDAEEPDAADPAPEEPTQEEPAAEEPDADEPDADEPAPEEPAEDAASDSEETDPSVEAEPALTEQELDEQAQMEAIEQVLRSMLRQRANTSYNYETELAKFPASYQSYLKALHEQHPDWVFVAVDTGLTWDAAIAGETGARSTVDYNLNGATSVMLMNNHGDFYDASSYSGTNHYRPIDGNHVSASRAMVAYYMDPRNFLMDRYIFQFEDQAYSAVQTINGVRTILAGTDLATASTYITTSGQTKSLAELNSLYGSDYATIIYNVGVATGVSPYFLASKIIQETGGDTSYAAISGNTSGYIGYYNFFNIGATASASGGAVYNGLAYARSKNWSNPVLSIYGGAVSIGGSYISAGQNTLYYMRFNVGPDAVNDAFTHQYMSSTYSVAAEATETYNGYNGIDAVDNAFLFFIPVYDGMPDQSATVSLTPTTKGTATRSCTLYSSPSTSGSRVTSVSSGAEVTILGGSVTDSTGYTNRLIYPYWYQVRVTVSGKTYTGYVQEQYVKTSATYTLAAGKTQSLSSVLSRSGNTGTIYYETSDPTVATVSDSGVITANANGSCTIYAISGGGSFDAVGVTVSGSGSSGDQNSTLAAPTVSASTVAKGIQVRWTQVSGAQSYRIYRKTGSSGWSLIASNVTSLSYTDTSALTSGTTYAYTVRGVKGSSLGSYDTAGASVLYLSTPALGSAAASASGIKVTWSKVTGASRYWVYRKSGSSGWTRVGITSSTSYTDSSSMTVGTKYTYTVRAAYGSSLSYFNTTGVSATAVSPGVSIPEVSVSTIATGIQIRWTQVTGAQSYYVYRKTGSSGWTRIAGGVTGLTYSDTSALTSGTTYRYTVRALKDGALGSYNTAGVAICYLSTPSLLSAQASAAGITVQWKQVTGATGYTVLRKTSGTDWAKVATISSGSTLSYTDNNGLKDGTRYTYTVCATAQNGLSCYNETGVSATAGSYTLDAPTVTAATAANGVKVQWTQVIGAQSYYVYRRTSSSNWTRIAVTNGSTRTYTDGSRLNSGITYYYTVRAMRSNTLGRYNTTGAAVLYLSTPVLVSASKSDSSITICWEQVAGANGYLIYRKVSGQANWTRIAEIKSGSTTSYTDSSGLSASQQYIYTVRARNGSQLSYFSATGIAALDTPSLISASNTANGVTVRWKAVTGAQGYRVYRRTSGANWTFIGTAAANATSYTDTKNLISGTAYAYTVRATWGRTMSNFSRNGVSTRYLAAPVLRSSSVSASGTTITWGQVAGATSYLVYRKTASGNWSRIAIVNSGATTSYTDPAGTGSTLYYYTVRARYGSYLSYYDDNGISTYGTLVPYVTTGDLNYRTGPGTNYPLAGTLKAGTTVLVISGSNVTVGDRVWYRAYIKNGVYYLSSAYLRKV